MNDIENKTQRLTLYLLHLHFCTLGNTIFTGKVYYCFDELPSTNDYAVQLIDTGINTEAGDESQQSSTVLHGVKASKSRPAEGSVVRAVNQSAGHGQFGSRWESAPGANLTLSVIWYPVWLSAARSFYLNIVAALAVRDVVTALRNESPVADNTTPVCVKWPNDVYIGDRKCAGILIQNGIMGHQLQWSVVGIGLNVNQSAFSNAAPNAVSLASAFGCSFDPDDVMQQLFVRLEQRYLQLKAGGDAALRALYESHLYLRAQEAIFHHVQEDVSLPGTITGVTEAGRLKLRTAHGEQTFEPKSLRFPHQTA